MRAPTKKRKSSGLCPAAFPARRRPRLGTRAHLSAGTAPRPRAARPRARPPRSRASRRRRVGGLGEESRRAGTLRRPRVCPPARRPLGHTPRRPRPRRPLPARPRPRETPPPRGGPSSARGNGRGSAAPGQRSAQGDPCVGLGGQNCGAARSELEGGGERGLGRRRKAVESAGWWIPKSICPADPSRPLRHCSPCRAGSRGHIAETHRTSQSGCRAAASLARLRSRPRRTLLR